MAGEQRQQTHEERTIAMKYTTGLPTAKFADLLIRLREEGVEGYPPSMEPFPIPHKPMRSST